MMAVSRQCRPSNSKAASANTARVPLRERIPISQRTETSFIDNGDELDIDVNIRLRDGSRIVQELMEELMPLMTDVYGNYVVQKFFEHGTQEQKTSMAGIIKKNMLRLSENKYGCRVVQKVGSFS